MPSAQLSLWLEWGRREGAQGVWFGGGEPTLHPDLVPALRSAREGGFTHLRIQTNGLRFAHLPFTKACLSAGADQFAISIKDLDSSGHSAMTRNPRSYELMIKGIENLHREGARVEGDVLMTRNNQDRLPAIVELYARLGISRFNFWLVSGHGLPDRVRSAWIPRMRDLAGPLEAAFRIAKRRKIEAVTLHTPPCVLPARWRSCYLHSGAWDLVVIPPDGDPFRAEESPMEGGTFLSSCRRCTSRTDCLGLRADYLDLFGGEEFTPLRSAARRSKS